MRTPSSHTLSWARDPLPPHKYLSGFFQAFTIKTVRTECEFIKVRAKGCQAKKGDGEDQGDCERLAGNRAPRAGLDKGTALRPRGPVLGSASRHCTCQFVLLLGTRLSIRLARAAASAWKAGTLSFPLCELGPLCAVDTDNCT